MKNIPVKNSLFILAWIFLNACVQKDHSRGMTEIKAIDNIKYELRYIPQQELQRNETVQLAELSYYKLTISEEKNSTKVAEFFKSSNYNRMLYYINSSIQKDFKSKYDNAEVNPVQVYFESNNKMAKRLVFMLAFEKFSDQTNNISIEFNDNIFNNGLVKFNYSANDLKVL